MKKLLSLLLAAMLCLCALLPAAAEEAPITRAPMAFTTFQALYNDLFTTAYPGNTISWITREISGTEAWGALMNDTLPMAMALLQDGNVSQIVLSYDGPMDEETVTVFIVQCVLVGGSLLTGDGMPAEAAIEEATNTLAENLSQALQGGSNEFSVWGVNALFSSTTEDGTNYEFLLVLTFNAGE
ncbi:MAG: hypothetical protein IJE07_02430 [Clostridia bacterium]|nr:hypothetical protein [Clostridia bacterium]